MRNHNFTLVTIGKYFGMLYNYNNDVGVITETYFIHIP